MTEQSKKPPITPIIIGIEVVSDVTSVSVSTLERMTREGKFPRPRKISEKRVGWLVSDVVNWANGLPVSDNLPPPNTGAPKPR